MEVHQEKSRYQPIKIILRTREEAKAFFTIVDKIECSGCYKSEAERQLIIDLSNAYSNADIVF